MAFDKVWREDTPSGTDYISEGDDRIRELKYAIRERLAVEHQVYDDETGETDVGEHSTGSARIASGNDVNKAASPKLNQLYYATDTYKLYHCKSAGTWTDVTAELAGFVRLTGNQDIEGDKTFKGLTTFDTSIPVAPATDPTTDNQLTRKKFVDDEIAGVNTTITNLQPLGVANLLHIQDQKTAGTNGGTFTSGAWRTRDLNTKLTDNISGASLASNKITLPAGTYYIEARAPAREVELHKAKLRRITATAADILIGTSELSRAEGGHATTWSIVSGVFTITGEVVFEIQHRCSSSQSTNGFGIASNLGVIEVYTDVKIWKVA